MALRSGAETLAMINKAPAYRQMILDPEATEVDRYEPATRADADERHGNVRHVVFLSTRDSNTLFNSADAAPSPADASATDAGRRRDRFARLRGWSEVYFSTYGKLLTTLDSRKTRSSKVRRRFHSSRLVMNTKPVMRTQR